MIRCQHAELVIAEVTGESIAMQTASSYSYSSSSIDKRAALRTSSRSRPLSLFSETVVLHVSVEDMNTLKSSYPLISSRNTSYVTVLSSFTQVYRIVSYRIVSYHITSQYNTSRHFRLCQIIFYIILQHITASPWKWCDMMRCNAIQTMARYATFYYR